MTLESEIDKLEEEKSVFVKKDQLNGVKLSELDQKFDEISKVFQ